MTDILSRLCIRPTSSKHQAASSSVQALCRLSPAHSRLSCYGPQTGLRFCLTRKARLSVPPWMGCDGADPIRVQRLVLEWGPPGRAAAAMSEVVAGAAMRRILGRQSCGACRKCDVMVESSRQSTTPVLSLVAPGSFCWREESEEGGGGCDVAKRTTAGARGTLLQKVPAPQYKVRQLQRYFYVTLTWWW